MKEILKVVYRKEVKLIFNFLKVGKVRLESDLRIKPTYPSQLLALFPEIIPAPGPRSLDHQGTKKLPFGKIAGTKAKPLPKKERWGTARKQHTRT